MRFAWLAGLLVLGARLHAGVDVRVSGDRVSLQAVSAPVAEILEGIARRTGMRLTYDAPLPRQTLSASFEDRTPAEAVLSVLEGLGLNYALVMDSSGTRVDQLLILGTASASASLPTAAPNRPAPPAHRQVPPEQEVLDDLEEEEEAGNTQADAMDDSDELEAQPEGAGATAQPAAPAGIGPLIPEYPSSPFSPRLPMPTPPPPAPSPAATPNPRNQ
jgi:hypothetical protein